MGLLATILTSLFLNVGLCACVEYDKNTGQYTVDKSGCVEDRYAAD